jgi:hypothetical protein
VDAVTQALQDADPILLIAGAVALLVLIALVVVKVVRGRRQRRELEERYGSEYTRTVQRAGSRRQAHQELMEREERRRTFDVVELEPAERERLRARLEALQTGFVDGPETAVRAAEELVDEIATAKGYPETDREQRLQDLAVDHPAAVSQHREAQEALRSDGRRPPTTEALREALLATRALAEMLIGREEASVADAPPPFSDLVDEDEAPTTAGPSGPRGDGRAPGPATATAGASPEPTSSAPLYGPDGRPIPEDDARRR